jgi:hypothetical protein
MSLHLRISKRWGANNKYFELIIMCVSFLFISMYHPKSSQPDHKTLISEGEFYLFLLRSTYLSMLLQKAIICNLSWNISSHIKITWIWFIIALQQKFYKSLIHVSSNTFWQCVMSCNGHIIKCLYFVNFIWSFWHMHTPMNPSSQSRQQASPSFSQIFFCPVYSLCLPSIPRCHALNCAP